jgi:hypothetical protein
LILIKAEFVKEDYVEHVISKSATVKNIEDAIKMLEVDKYIELVDERNCRIETHFNTEGGFSLTIVETLINGDVSLTFAEEPSLNVSNILKAFDLFHHKNHTELMKSFKWRVGKDMADVKREIEQEYEEKYGAFNKEIEETLRSAEINSDFLLAQSLKDIDSITKEHNEGLFAGEKKENYSPSFWDVSSHGGLNNKIICSQCGENGCVHTKSASKKAGISGGKATAALLTGGISLLGFGLSRKEKVTEAYCGNCKSTWYF